MKNMRLITLCVPKGQLDGLDTLVFQGLYPNRSEAIRLAIRDLLMAEIVIPQTNNTHTHPGLDPGTLTPRARDP